MNYEIEKKYHVPNHDLVKEELDKEYGESKLITKAGFWWCNNYKEFENVMDITRPQFLKKHVEALKSIGEFNLEVQDYQYARIRIFDYDRYVLTFKIKQLVNKVEQNIEYEFETDKSTINRIFSYLLDTSMVFFYNIKKTYTYKSGNFSIELSHFNDLRDAYMEVETTGQDKDALVGKLDKFLEDFKKYHLNEELKSYHALSLEENKKKLERTKLSNYSREAVINLRKYI